MVGRLNAVDILTPTGCSAFHDNFPKLKAGSDIGNLDLDFLRKDGTTFPVRLSATAVRDENGHLIMTRSVVHDQSAAQQADERFRLLFENSLDGILLTSPDGSVLEANPSACRIFGLTRNELLKAGREGLLDLSDPAVSRFIEERERSGKASGELLARRSDGTLFPQEVSSVVFVGPHGKKTSCVIFRDITFRKETEAERERLVAELVGALARVRVLSGLLPVCSWCKKIRDGQGKWSELDVFVREHTDVEVTHGICPECRAKFPDVRKS